MSVQPIGLLTIVAGFVCLLLGPRVAIAVFIPSILLGSAAALLLGASGQVQPAHLLLAFVVPTILCRRRPSSEVLRNMAFPRAGFWLTSVVVLGVASAVFLPRVLSGVTYVNAIGAAASDDSFASVPLSPVGGNLTQSIYLTADLACFLTVLGFAEMRDGTVYLAKAVVAFAALNVAFALIDIGTYATGTSFLLDPIRNAQYTLHLDEVTGGLKRIAGSFPETSAFSTASLGAVGFTATLWLQGRWSAWTGCITLSSVALLVLSTSSTAVFGGPPLLALIYAMAFRHLGRRAGGRTALALVLGGPLLLGVAACAIALDGAASETVSGLLQTLVFDKASSQSGLERASWNIAALQNFVDTRGLGAGLGSVRSSSFLVAVPANLGVAGCVLFGAFLWSVFGRSRAAPDGDVELRTAARNGCIGLLLAASISGTLVDLGLLFFVLAGLAYSGRPRRPLLPRRSSLQAETMA